MYKIQHLKKNLLCIVFFCKLYTVQKYNNKKEPIMSEKKTSFWKNVGYGMAITALGIMLYHAVVKMLPEKIRKYVS